MNTGKLNKSKLNSILEVARLAQSVEHGTLSIKGSGIPGSWVRAPRWTKLAYIFPPTFDFLDEHRQIELDKMNS